MAEIIRKIIVLAISTSIIFVITQSYLKPVKELVKKEEENSEKLEKILKILEEKNEN